MGRRPKAKRSSLRHLSAALEMKGHAVSRPTVSKLLRKLKYSPKVNARRTEVRGASPAQRHEQFDHINEQREDFGTTGDPIISVDTKKRTDWRLQKRGKTWRKVAEPVLVHDWPQDAIGQAIPYGVYEVNANQGFYVNWTTHPRSMQDVLRRVAPRLY
jgi:hypothetical protein